MVSFLLVRDTASPWMLYVFVILFGFGSGSTGPIIAAAPPDLFPGDSLGRIMGTFTIGFGLGGAIPCWVFLRSHGSYTPFLLVIATISLGILAICMAATDYRRTHAPTKNYV